MIAKSIKIRYNASNHENNFQFNSWEANYKVITYCVVWFKLAWIHVAFK